MKITIIGAGNVGGALAQRIMDDGAGDCVLFDIVKNLAQAKALDLSHAAPLVGCRRSISGTDDYGKTEGSDIVVITAGLARQPGMSRADLLKLNGSIIKDAVKNIAKTSGSAVIIVVTNPLDIMTYLALKEGRFKPAKVMGMAGLLDAARFTHLLAEELRLESSADIETLVLGEHGPGMVPILSRTKVSGRPVRELIKEARIGELVDELCESGAKIVKLLGKGSAYYAPSAAAFKMIKMIENGSDEITGVSCLAQGEYGLSGVCVGLPVRLGRNGIEEVAELKLDPDESKALKESAETIKRLIGEL